MPLFPAPSPSTLTPSAAATPHFSSLISGGYQSACASRGLAGSCRRCWRLPLLIVTYPRRELPPLLAPALTHRYLSSPVADAAAAATAPQGCYEASIHQEQEQHEQVLEQLVEEKARRRAEEAEMERERELREAEAAREREEEERRRTEEEERLRVEAER